MKPRYAAHILLAVVLICLWAVALSRAATPRPDLLKRMPATHVHVIAADNAAEWDREVRAIWPGTPGTEIAAFTHIRAREIHLSPTIAVALTRGPRYPGFANAAETLYHEWAHAAFQSSNEGMVECISLLDLRYFLRHYWHLSTSRAQALYVEAWRVHKTLPPPYGNAPCVFQPRDPLRGRR